MNHMTVGTQGSIFISEMCVTGMCLGKALVEARSMDLMHIHIIVHINHASEILQD